MKLKAWSFALPLSFVGFLVLALSSGGVAQQAPAAGNNTVELPPGPGREPFLHICSGCHATSVVTSERRTAESWATVIDDMRARGAVGSDEDMDKITDWLAANYAPKPAESKPTSPTPP